MYHVKEAFYSVQGEGAHTGRPALFCRFAGCNLWSGREPDRNQAVCSFCDTDFIGTDGQNGGRFTRATALVSHLAAL
ncbi:MAG: 7-carboxy-7-deazaguanine synthase, partial [Natronospirillum sp.]